MDESHKGRSYKICEKMGTLIYNSKVYAIFANFFYIL